MCLLRLRCYSGAVIVWICAYMCSDSSFASSNWKSSVDVCCADRKLRARRKKLDRSTL